MTLLEQQQKRRFAHAALVYGVLNCGATVLVGTVIAPPEEGAKVLVLPSLAVIALLAFWVHYGARWLTRLLAVVCALRGIHHTLSFVLPTPLFWSTPYFTNLPIADGSRHWAWLCSATMLGTAAWFLGGAGWPPPAPVPGPAATGGPGPAGASTGVD